MSIYWTAERSGSHFLLAEHCAFSLVCVMIFWKVLLPSWYILWGCCSARKMQGFFYNFNHLWKTAIFYFNTAGHIKMHWKKKKGFVLLLHAANKNGCDRLFSYCWDLGVVFPLCYFYSLPYGKLQWVFCTKTSIKLTKMGAEIHFRHLSSGVLK